MESYKKYLIPVSIVVFVDIMLQNALLLLITMVCKWMPLTILVFLLWNVCYILSVSIHRPFAQLRLSRVEQIAQRSAITVILMQFIFMMFALVIKDGDIIFWHVLVVWGVSFFCMFFGRFAARKFLMFKRRSGRNTISVIFIGAGHNLAYLYDNMAKDLSTGYRVLGYFEDVPSKHLPDTLQRIGPIALAVDWMEHHHVESVYCNLPSSRSLEIINIINYCESHFIHFYSVPNVRNYVHRAMQVEMMNDMPVLTLRKEPLSYLYNRVLKRAFDVVVSGLFLLLGFWWIYIIVAIITKITMPGPVLFKQKRNGLLGKEFTCLKFRSMKVNADADRLQATKDDPRKTKWGNIMRKTSIDELPQFINVFLGDMSIVGPRPHMVKQTEEYSELINKYMVRHWVKPGITGWAQVMGSRGETHELWQMEERIKKDIWYIENWSLWLDIRIMIKTVTNALGGDKQAY